MHRRHLFELIQTLRRFFYQAGFLEALTPPLVQNPGMETHVHPFQVWSVRNKKTFPLYLHTSPEFCLKELLAEGFKDLYSLSYCFRDEPDSPIHRNQFLMLEWYRSQQRYERIMRDVEELIKMAIQESTIPLRTELKRQTIQHMTMQDLWLETIGVDPLQHLEATDMRRLIAKNFPDVPLPKTELAWDDLFFLLHLNKVEPQMHQWPLLMVNEFPAPLAALSTLKLDDPRVCERFELYVCGIELCNAYNELTDGKELRARFQKQNQEKKTIYGYELPEPEVFFAAMDRGLPPSAGVALGVERLLHALFEVEHPFFY